MTLVHWQHKEWMTYLWRHLQVSEAQLCFKVQNLGSPASSDPWTGKKTQTSSMPFIIYYYLTCQLCCFNDQQCNFLTRPQVWTCCPGFETQTAPPILHIKVSRRLGVFTTCDKSTIKPFVAPERALCEIWSICFKWCQKSGPVKSERSELTRPLQPVLHLCFRPRLSSVDTLLQLVDLSSCVLGIVNMQIEIHQHLPLESWYSEITPLRCSYGT